MIRSVLGVVRPAAPWTAAVALSVAIVGCGSGGGGAGSHDPAGSGVKHAYGTALYGALPTPGDAKPGETLTIGQISGSTPTYIFPIESAANTTPWVENLVSNLFLPLYNVGPYAVAKTDYKLSAANPPRFTDGNRTVTIPLKHNLKWADGAPVDANDVLFYIALLKAAVKESAANWGEYTPGMFPDNVASARAPDKYTVVLRLDKPYNPDYFLNDQLQLTDTGVYPLPSTAWNIASPHGPHLNNWSDPAVAKQIYDYLNKAGSSVSTFASNPLWKDVDGPFSLKSFSATNGSYELVANPHYGLSPKPATAGVSYQTFTSVTSELTALTAGELDIDPNLDTTQLAQANRLRGSGVSVFGAPDFGWTGGIINFKDTTDHFDKVIAQLYVRQAISHLVDQAAMITGIYKNAAVPDYGPLPSEPTSPYTPHSAKVDPFPYGPAAAVALLKSHGWTVRPGGQTTCARAGTEAGECGAGIPAGTPLKFVWATPSAAEYPANLLASEAVASIAKQAAGINITVQTKTSNFLITNYNDANPGATKYTNDWGVNNLQLTNLSYPTQEGAFTAKAPFNLGGYDDPIATRLMLASVSSPNPSAVKTETSYLQRHPPLFFLPEQDGLAAVSRRVGGTPGSWLALTQQFQLLQYWYVKR